MLLLNSETWKNFRERIRRVVGILDPILGIRSWGLVFYGALPSSLSLIGFLEIKDIKFPSVKGAMAVVLVSLLPLLVTFLLVRAREGEWYLTEDHLNLRSCITTLLILLSTTMVSGSAGFIRGASFSREYVTQSFLFGVASLVISSSLFATVLTKAADLPGLPSVAFLDSLTKIREQLRGIRNSAIWGDCTPETLNEVKAASNDLVEELKAARKKSRNGLAKQGLKLIQADLEQFNFALHYIETSPTQNQREPRWKKYFEAVHALPDSQKHAPEKGVATLSDSEKREIVCQALRRLSELNLGG